MDMKVCEYICFGLLLDPLKIMFYKVSQTSKSVFF